MNIKGLFYIMRAVQKKFGIPYDKEYWKKQGWFDKNHPWKNI